MGIIEMVKKGFGIATKSLGLVLILIIFNLIWNVISIPLVQQGVKAPPSITITTLILGILFVLVSIFVQGGSLGLVRDYIKQGKMKLSQMASYGAKYYLRLLGLGVLIVLVIAIVGLLAALIVLATTPLNNTILTAAAAIIAVVIGAIGLYFVFLLMLAPYALICNEMGVIESMKASVKRVRGALVKVLLLLVVLVLISLGIGFLVGFLTGLVSVALPATGGQLLIAIVNSIFNGYLGVVMMASFMTLYLKIAAE